jgi:hypothetical protein
MVLPNKDKMNERIMDYFNDQGKTSNYMMVNSICLAASHLVVVCKKRLAAYISNVQNDTLAIGVADMLSNKGAVSISFNLG